MQINKTIAADYVTTSKICKTQNLIVEDGVILRGLETSKITQDGKDSDAINTLRKLLAMHNAFKYVYANRGLDCNVDNLMCALVGDGSHQTEQQKAFEDTLK